MRLDEKFQRIARSFQDIRTAPEGFEPEQVIVLETVGKSVEGLARAAARIPGLEWLAERDLEDSDPGDGFYDERHLQKKLSHRLYALFTNQQAMNALLALWREWHTNPGQRMRRNFGPFKHLFVHLKDVRRWGVRDRIAETGVLEYWEENLRIGRARIFAEVELWSHQDAGRRQRAYEILSRLVETQGGRCVCQTAIPDILYHGVLLDLPTDTIRQTVDRLVANGETELLQCEEVMFFRAVGQARIPCPPAAVAADGVRDRMQALPLPTGDPLIALLDGLPLEQHVALAGRLMIDDPDEHGLRYEAGTQYHGTAMASLIVHGDLGAAGDPLSRPVYTRPIYVPFTDLDGNLAYEGTPADCLLVDLIHRAVRRIKGGDGSECAVATSVKVINLSFGNEHQPFDRNLTPLGRLLDWLAWKYNILFLVSSGNQVRDIVIPMTQAEWAGLAREARATRTLKAMRDDQVFRRPFSPAEAVNVLTVGALHADECGPIDDTDIRVDLLGGRRLPTPVSTVASGFRRSVKPEILLPGGRQLYRPAYGNDRPVVFSPVRENPIGQIVAAPGQRPLQLDRVRPCCGTSNSTALASRSAHLVGERLGRLRGEPGGERLDDVYVAALVKTLLVHGASWGQAAEFLAGAFPDLERRDLLRLQGRFLGYGELALERSLFATEQRVTLLGWGTIREGEGHLYGFPLPPSLSASILWRRLTITLAWLTPINPRHQNYRKAFLWFHLPGEVIGVSSKELDYDASRRGTVQHRVMEGEQAIAFLEGEKLCITVSCREDAGTLAEAIPYGLALTLEVAEGVDVNIYDEIQARIRPQVPITPLAV